MRELSITASRHQLVQAKKANSTGVAQCAIREGEIIAGRGIKYIIKLVEKDWNPIRINSRIKGRN